MLTENFIDVLVNANQWSPKLAGKLIKYNDHKKCFEIYDKNCIKKGYKIRSLFLLFNATALLLRILVINFPRKFQSSKSTNNTDMNLCFMMLLICIVPAERYRVRGKFPDEFATFFNQIIRFEGIHIRGKD